MTKSDSRKPENRRRQTGSAANPHVKNPDRAPGPSGDIPPWPGKMPTDSILEHLFTLIPDLFFVYDEFRRIIDYRVTDERMLYTLPDEFLYKPMEEFLPPGMLEITNRLMDETQRSGTTARTEYSLEKRDGNRRYESRMTWHPGQRQFFAIVRDISSQYEDRINLEKSEASQRRLLENAPFPILITRMDDGTILYCNRRAEVECGISLSGSGAPHFRLFSPGTVEWEWSTAMLEQSRSIYDWEVQLARSDGSPYWALVSAAVVEYRGERAIMTSINDIDARKQAELDLKVEQRKLQKRIRERQGFYQIVAAAAKIELSPEEVFREAAEAIPRCFLRPGQVSAVLEYRNLRSAVGKAPADGEILQAVRLLSDGQPLTVTVTVPTADPETGTAADHAEVRELLEGIAESLASYRERRRTVDELRDREELLATMFDSTSDAMVLVNPEDFRFIDCNPVACESLGYSREEFLALTVADIQAEHSIETIRKNMSDGIRGERLNFRTCHRTRNGSIIKVSVSLRAIAHYGRPLLFAVWRDITEEERRKEEEAALMERLKRYPRILTAIAGSEANLSGDIGSLSVHVTELLSEVFPVDRISIWFFSEDGRRLECADLFEPETRRHSQCPPMTSSKFAPDLQTFMDERFIAVGDPVAESPMSPPYRKRFYEEIGLGSTLDCRIACGNRPYGIVSFGVIGAARNWENDEVTFACQAADQLGMAMLNRDRLETARALRQSEFFLERAQALSHTGHWHLSIQPRIMTASTEACAIFGLTSADCLDEHFMFAYLAPEFRAEVAAAWNRALEGHSFMISCRIIVGGKTKWIELRAEIESDQNGRTLALLGTVRDITQQVTVELTLNAYRQHLEEMVASRTRELEQARWEAESASRAKTTFLANMSHEIRTPMNAVLGYAHLLRQDPLTSRQQRQLDRLTHSADQLLSVINDILDLSKIEADKFTITKEEFSPARVIDQVFHMLAEQAAGKELEMIADLHKVPAIVQGDSRRFAQIMLNLIGNAIKFTQSGYVAVRGRTAASSEDQVKLIFMVEDTGIGISEEQLSRLFQPFEQADSSTSRLYGGTGLGLTISRRLAEMMSGGITAESRIGQGASFRLELPFGAAAAGVSLLAGLSRLKGRRVLVIDDFFEARTVLAEMLREAGMQVSEADSGESGIAAIESADRDGAPFTDIIVDWNMPGMNGAQTLRAIRKLRIGMKPALLTVTASDEESHSDHFRAAAVDIVLCKPVTPSVLHDAFKHLFDKNPNSEQISGLALKHALARRYGSQILVVEDNVLNQEVSSQLLESAGMEVTIAGSGLQAIEAVRSQWFDLILMDIQMPELDGYETTRIIRSLPGWKHRPILAMTAHAFHEDREESIASGLNDHITKPVEPETLYRKLVFWLPERNVRLQDRQWDETPPAPPRNSRIPRYANLQREQSSGQAGADSEGRVAEKELQDDRPAPDPGGATGSGQQKYQRAGLSLIEGIDPDSGLKYFMGDEELYCEMLLQFADSHALDGKVLADALAADNRSRIGELSHNLKGLAATLGAQNLRNAAAKLEQSVRNHEAAEILRSDIVTVGSLIDEVTASLRSALGSDAGEDTLQQKIDPTGKNRMQAIRVLEQLAFYLRLSDTGANELIDSSSALLKAFLGDDLKRIARLVEMYEYQAALLLVEEVIRKLSDGD